MSKENWMSTMTPSMKQSSLKIPEELDNSWRENEEHMRRNNLSMYGFFLHGSPVSLGLASRPNNGLIMQLVIQLTPGVAPTTWENTLTEASGPYQVQALPACGPKVKKRYWPT